MAKGGLLAAVNAQGGSQPALNPIPVAAPTGGAGGLLAAVNANTPTTTASPPAHHGTGGILGALEKTAGSALDVGTLGLSGAVGGPHGYVPTKYSPAGLIGNLGKDIGETAIGAFPGTVKFAKDFGQSAYTSVTHPERHLAPENDPFTADIHGVAQQYKDYYGHDQLRHLYQHPLQPILDAATVADLAGGVGAKLGVLGDARTEFVTRSPRAVATGKGPTFTELSSTKPLVRGRETLVNQARNVTHAPTNRPGGFGVVGSELKQYGKAVQRQAEHHALENIQGYGPYVKATRRLTENEWSALHIRAMGIHPDDLKVLWKGTPLEKTITNPAVERLVLSPSTRMVRAEPEAVKLSAQGEQLLKEKGLLADSTAENRPALTRAQAAETLGRDVAPIPGGPEPYYFPHTVEPQPSASPLFANDGGKGVPRVPGSAKQNQGILALSGKLHLRSDVLGPEFLRRVKYVKYDEIHNALVRGAVRVTKVELDEKYDGKLPKGWEYVREKASTRIPFTVRGESTQGMDLKNVVPDATDLHDSQLARDGFSTTDPTQAHLSGGKYYIVPKATTKAATGEFTRSSDFMHYWVSRPLQVWRSVILGLRVGFLTNNLIGNSLMYAVKTGGEGAIRHLFMAMMESHGRETALRLLKSQATPPGIRADLVREFFPEQVEGTFGKTQSPATSRIGKATGKAGSAYRTTTGAIPRLTSKVAEELPRRALVRHYIEKSPEFRKVYRALPRQTRTFETAARKVLEGKGAAPYQRLISKQVNQALGDYLHLSGVERNVLRNTLPFYSWYRAIVTTTYHLGVDTPLRANILGQIGRIGQEQTQQELGDLPSFLEGSIGLGHGPNGTQRVLTTQSLNPWATLGQLQRGAVTDFSALGVNPFIQGPLDYVQHAKGNVSPGALAMSPLLALLKGLPPSQLVAPPGPSALYPNRNRLTNLEGQFGVPVKEYNPAVAEADRRKGY